MRENYCTNCGAARVPEAGIVCPACGQIEGQLPPAQSGQTTLRHPPQQQQHPVQVDNYLVWAILATICCCMPTGVVAIVYSAMANAKGNTSEAQRTADTARTWVIISVILGIPGNILVWALFF